MISPVRRVYSTAQALAWALDLASALEYLHARSPMILHRDVKLSNVVLVEEGPGLVAKLADMGLHMVGTRAARMQQRI
jgi:serine/threonine protein kinase